MWRTDLGRARYLLYAFIICGDARLGLARHAELLGLSADPRRRRHLVSHRRRPPLVSSRRTAPRRADRGDRAASAARLCRRRGSSLLPASRRRSDRARARGGSQRPRAARVQGGSTLTQQLARTLFLSNRKSYGRKAREAVLAFLIEAQLSKQQILELYLNRIFLGAGIYGVEAMSQRVFGKPAKIADAGRERADRRPGARAGGAVAVVESRRGARAQSRRAGAHARREIHHRAGVSRRAAGAVARPPLSQRQRVAPRLCEGLPAAAVPR